MPMEFKTPQKAWDELQSYRYNVYNSLSAMYSGNHAELNSSGDTGSFWKRTGSKGKMHVPIMADIAATSANLMFGQEPTFTIYKNDEELNLGAEQDRLGQLIDLNGIENKLLEAAETCAALGDIYLKIRWNKLAEYPFIDVVEADSAWAEYILGDLACLHCFSEFSRDDQTGKVIRIYERYTKGEIHMEMFDGNDSMLGTSMGESVLAELGYQSDIKSPIDEIMAVHIANVRPNRKYRGSMLGRSDFDGLRDLCDALDETYSSWIRDIRLAKAKLIVPVDYLRRKPQEMLDGVAQNGSWEFDPDIETYVAMDIQTADNASGNYITPSQFDIRSQQHADTCNALVELILQLAGYSPQTFGLQINGSASSGTALNIRERKTASTRDKKQVYWIAPLERIMTMLVRVDKALYPSFGSDAESVVRLKFADGLGFDASLMASTAQMLFSAQSASVDTRVRLQHPDWTEQEVLDEIDRITQEFSIMTQDAVTTFGKPVLNEEEPTE